MANAESKNKNSLENKNYGLLLCSGFLTRVSDLLSSSKLVIPWLLTTVGVPAFFTGLLVPIRESGAMLPQIFIGGWIKQQPIRKYIYLVASICQSLAILGMLLSALFFKSAAGWWVLLCVVFYSLARSFSSVTSSDILGKSIKKSQRGKLSGSAVSLAGAISVLVGGLLVFSTATSDMIMALLLLSAMFMAVSGMLYHFLYEEKGQASAKKNSIKQQIGLLTIIKTDVNFRYFVITRALMLSSALATPYIVLLAQQASSSYQDTSAGYDVVFQLLGLGGFIALSGLASLLSGRFFGKKADYNSKKMMKKLSIMTSIICFFTAGFGYFSGLLFVENKLFLTVCYALSFFMLAITHQGVRLARSTYIVDLAEGNQRTTYVIVSNTVIGILLLLVGFFSAGLSYFSVKTALFFLGVLSLCAAIYSNKLKSV